MNKPPNPESEESTDPVDSSADKVTTKANKQSGQRRWVKWTRRLAILVFILGGLAYFVNGPIARWAVLHYLNKGLVEQGMTGSAEVEGTVLGGIVLRDLDYIGEDGIQQLSIGLVEPKYTLSGLLDSKIDGIKVDSIKAKIDVSGFPENPDEIEEDPNVALEKTLATLRPWLVQPEILVEDLDVELVDAGKPVLNWQLASLSHAADSADFHLNEWMVEEASGLKTPVQSVVLSWQEKLLQLDRLEVLPDLEISELKLNWVGSIRGEAKLSMGETEFEASASDVIRLKLTQGKLASNDLVATAKKFGVELDFEGDAVLSELDVELRSWQELAIPEWDVSLSSVIEKAQYQEYVIENAKLDLRQKGFGYEVGFIGSANSAPVELELVGKWTNSKDERWWESTIVQADIKAESNAELLKILPKLPDNIELGNTTLSAQLEVEIVRLELSDFKADAQIEKVALNKIVLPKVDLKAHWDKTRDQPVKLTMEVRDGQAMPLQILGEYHLEKQEYMVFVELDVRSVNRPSDVNRRDKIEWVNSLLELIDSPVVLQDDIILSWKGRGDLNSEDHMGTLIIRKATVSQPDMKDALPVSLQTKVDYRWPIEVNVEQLDLQQDELSTTASFNWDGERVKIGKFELFRDDKAIGSVTGEVPYELSVDSVKKFVEQTAPWSITVDTEELSLKRISKLFPLELLENASGVLQTKMNLTGSPSAPDINGNLTMVDLKGEYGADLGAINVLLGLESKDGKLAVKGKMTEAGEDRVTIDLTLPFAPRDWLNDENLIETLKTSANVKGRAEIKKLPLDRLKNFYPQLEKIEGMIEGVALFEGTVLDPKYSLEFKADFPVLNIKGIGVDEIKDLKLHGKINERLIMESELSAKVNGGKFKADIVADVNDADDPSFELMLKLDHALVYRDDLIATRANGDILFKGKLSEATISGDLGIVESIIFKDLDLIPIGVPSSAVESVKLPALESKNAQQGFDIPAPFNNWKLKLSIRTDDPILIRGNVGKGRLEGSLKAAGTLSNPMLAGTLYARDVKAKLPFSFLTVGEGKIVFRPQNGLIPTLQINGKSQIGSYNVNLNVYGSADSPKTAFSSYPPLPEHEIMTLLATGTTNAGLENRDVATFKALQILLLELKDKSDQPGGNKLFSALLSGMEDLDLRVGEVDDLTGEKYASATVKLHERWYLTTQFDSSGQTRGLVVFALRFN